MRKVKQPCAMQLDYQWVYLKEVYWGLSYSHCLQHLWEIYVGIMIRISICMLMTLNYMHHSLWSSDKSRESYMSKINSCVAEISKWMSINLLKLNEDKSEIMFIATCQQLSKFLPKIGSSVKLNGTEIRHSSSVWNLGYLMDSKFKNDAYINKICSTSFLYLQKIIKVWHLMDKKTTQVVFQALVLSRIDYCNSLLVVSAEYQIDKLQRIQNLPCRVICSVKKYENISYHLKDLCWLHVCEHIAYKICIMFKCFRNIVPKYLAELVRFDRNHNRNLQSNLKFLAQVPRSSNVQTSMSAFSIIGPKLWNGLPVTLNIKENIKDFKVALKTLVYFNVF